MDTVAFTFEPPPPKKVHQFIIHARKPSSIMPAPCGVPKLLHSAHSSMIEEKHLHFVVPFYNTGVEQDRVTRVTFILIDNL